MEIDIYEWFAQRGRFFVEDSFFRRNDIIFLMQHYRVPTRLLDWSENPFVALYFALNSCLQNSTNEAVVWILLPKLWNNNALTLLHDKVPYYEDEVLNGFRLDLSKNTIIAAENPVAVYGVHNNQRIMSQRGVFTIFGRSAVPMESLFEKFTRDFDCLQRLVIPKDKVQDMVDSLYSMGYSDSVIYPDLEGLSMEIKRKFQFGR